mmetsp:Transcript_12594/g.38519  ORF Transcript_12594/g.38519 Transcript_12594/m.38519 type:complete len:521 (+) Transcript_12594:401-1963(+)
MKRWIWFLVLLSTTCADVFKTSPVKIPLLSTSLPQLRPDDAVNVELQSLRQSRYTIVEVGYNDDTPFSNRPDPFVLVGRNGSFPRLKKMSGDRPPVPVHAHRHDDEAFVTWRSYHYVVVEDVAEAETLQLSVVNWGATVRADLRAKLRVRQTEEKPCPIGSFATNEVCMGRGICSDGKCICKHGFGGRYCETRVHTLPGSDFVCALEPNKMTVFEYRVPRDGNVALQMRSLNGTSRPVMFAKREFENGGRLLDSGPPLPTIYDIAFSDYGGFHAADQTLIKPEMQQGDVLYIGLFNWNTLLVADGETAETMVALKTSLCGGPNEKECPKPLTWSRRQEAYRNLVVIVLLATLVAVTGFATLLTMFRVRDMLAEHPRETLSQKQIERAFPNFLLRQYDDDALNASGETECVICLGCFDLEDSLRRLGCGHTYHSGCLDPWLQRNAACPRCRRSANIERSPFSSWKRRFCVAAMIVRMVPDTVHLVVDTALGRAFGAYLQQARGREVTEMDPISGEEILAEP